MIQVFDDNGTTSVVRIYGGEAHVHLSGDFGSGTLKIQFQADDGLWYDISGASWTAAADELVDVGNNTGYSLRGVLSGSTDPDLTVSIRD